MQYNEIWTVNNGKIECGINQVISLKLALKAAVKGQVLNYHNELLCHAFNACSSQCSHLSVSRVLR